MDCRTALEILECRTLPVAPRAAEPSDVSDVAAAQAHLDDCPRCAATLSAIEERDREIAQAMRDVPLPEGLRERLLAALASESPSRPSVGDAGEPAAVAAPVETAPPAASRRRAMRRWAGLMAAAACVAVGIWWMGTTATATIRLAEARQEAGTSLERFSELPEFDRGFAALSPAGWAAELRITPPRGWERPGIPGHAGALYAFQLGERSAAVQGIVLAIPAARIDVLPEREYFDPHSPEYAGAFATVVWREGDLVYICAVRGGGQQLERLRQALFSIT